MKLEEEIIIDREVQNIKQTNTCLPFNYYQKMVNMYGGSPISKSTINDSLSYIAEALYCVFNTGAISNTKINPKRTRIYQSSLITICFYKRLQCFLDLDTHDLARSNLNTIEKMIREKTFYQSLYPLYLSLIKNCRQYEAKWNNLILKVNDDIKAFYNKDYPFSFSNPCDIVCNQLLANYFPISLCETISEIDNFLNKNVDTTYQRFLNISLKTLCTQLFPDVIFHLPATANSFWIEYHTELLSYLNSDNAKEGKINEIILQDYFTKKYAKYLYQEYDIINRYCI